MPENSLLPHATLQAAADLPAVSRARSEAEHALSELRFHEGLRRQWEAARAEAAIREATALALLEGARISVDDLRELSMRESRDLHPEALDPVQSLALGLWRAQWNLASSFPPLNARVRSVRRPRPVPALMAALHRDMCSGLVEAGLVNAREVALPAHPGELAAVRALLQAPLPAWVCAAEVSARLRVTPVFSVASAALGAALARWVLVERGVDPSAVAVITALHALDVPASEGALAAWRLAHQPGAGQDEVIAGLGQWYEFFARAVLEGARIGQDVALHVQAGRL
ncbi:hypothetical protein [Schaalia sp. Marseille-Q2122]|uniref:hypothetical protein n=1 Tax=Schaalia sp. Marseille-Q2122 TaxID=2736604 RepID=UPI00158D412B|nr:hypothetical protein [Schaalia sp. Marseille-Q2122]